MTTARAKCARNVTRLGMRDQVEHTYMSTFSLATVYVTLSGHANTSYLNVQRNTHFFTFYLWFHTMTHLQYTLYYFYSTITVISNAVSDGMRECSKTLVFFSLLRGQK